MKFVEILVTKFSSSLDSCIIKPKVSIVSDDVNTSQNNESNESDIQDLRSSRNKHENVRRDENSDASLRNTGLQHKGNIQGEISALFIYNEIVYYVLRE